MKNILKKVVKAILPQSVLAAAKGLVSSDRLKAYEGAGVICSICNSEFKVFAPGGKPQRNNAKCPGCGSRERHRLLWKYLNEKTDFNSRGKIKLLHFAPEKIFFERFSSRQEIEYYPADLFPELYQFNPLVKVHKVDITNIPFEGNFFDVVICSHVLEHIPDDGKAMNELYRVMRNDGWGILQVPIDYNRENTYEDFAITTPEEREKAFGQHNHVRWYGRDYKNRLQNANFAVNEDDYVKTFSKEDIFRYGFNPSEFIYYCRKG